MDKNVELLIREAFCAGAIAGGRVVKNDKGAYHEASLGFDLENISHDDVFKYVQWDFAEYLRSLKGAVQEAEAYYSDFAVPEESRAKILREGDEDGAV